MNRTIKFRGKRVDNGKWVYGFIYQSRRNQLHGNPILEMVIRDSEYNNHQVIPETVSQFTGLHDKNGKEIYEGDYITITENEFKYGEGPVSFKNASFYVNDMYLSDINWENLLPQITGNIHDND